MNASRSNLRNDRPAYRKSIRDDLGYPDRLRKLEVTNPTLKETVEQVRIPLGILTNEVALRPP
jgi:hypothetical protein